MAGSPDASAAGPVTPGPVLSSATFIGGPLAGPAGVALTTGAALLPAFVIVAFLGPLLPRLQSWQGVRKFLNGVSAAVVEVILAVTVRLALGVPWDVGTALLLATSGGLVLLARWPAWAVVMTGLGGGGWRYLIGQRKGAARWPPPRYRSTAGRAGYRAVVCGHTSGSTPADRSWAQKAAPRSWCRSPRR